MVSLLHKYHLSTSWEIPNGVKIIQSYNVVEEDTFRFKIDRKSRSVVIRSPSQPKKTNTMKSRNAIVPNIIHSLDSTHLNMIIKHFIDLELPILTVHDCFIIHPNHWLILRNAVIDKYIELYADHKFIDSYHSKCLEQFRAANIRIHNEDGQYIITYTGEKIPNHPYQDNPNHWATI